MTVEDLIYISQAAQGMEGFSPLVVALTFGFMGFLRISNMAPPTAAAFDISRHTTFGDVVQQDQGLIINLKWSKTRQATHSSVSIPLPGLGSSHICPLKAWRMYNWVLRDHVVTKETPLLITTEPPVGRPITIPSLRRIFHQAVDRAQLEDSGYTPHSLRRGGATFAYHAGVPIDAIKRHGTWRSDAVEAYLFSKPMFDTPVAARFAKLLNDFNNYQ